MVASIKQKLASYDQLVGMHMQILSTEVYSIDLVILERKKGQIQIVRQLQGVTDVDLLSKHFSKDTPIALNLDGRGIIHRKLDAQSNGDQVLQSIIPNAQVKDFHLQMHDSHSKQFVSVIRNEQLDQWLSIIVSKGFSIVDFSMGPFCLSTIIPFLDEKESDIILDGYQLNIEDGAITDFRTLDIESDSEKSFQLGEETVSGSSIIPYTMGLKGFLEQTALSAQLPLIVQESAEEWQQKKIFKRSGIGVLAFFLMILLVNALLFFTLSQTNQELGQKLSANSIDLQRLENLRDEVAKKKLLINNLGGMRSSQISFYADQLAASLPGTIRWSTLEIHPMDEDLYAKDRKQYFERDLLVVTGRTDQPLALNQWLDDIRQMPWTTGLEGQQYAYNEREKTGIFNFKILVK